MLTCQASEERRAQGPATTMKDGLTNAKNFTHAINIMLLTKKCMYGILKLGLMTNN